MKPVWVMLEKLLEVLKMILSRERSQVVNGHPASSSWNHLEAHSINNIISIISSCLFHPGGVSTDASTDPLITHAEAAKLLNSLLKLRQACCHPQVGSSGLRSLQQSPMTMEEILMVV
jgi:SNF2 family DNA or RNA helicase